MEQTGGVTDPLLAAGVEAEANGRNGNGELVVGVGKLNSFSYVY